MLIHTHTKSFMNQESTIQLYSQIILIVGETGHLDTHRGLDEKWLLNIATVRLFQAVPQAKQGFGLASRGCLWNVSEPLLKLHAEVVKLLVLDVDVAWIGKAGIGKVKRSRAPILAAAYWRLWVILSTVQVLMVMIRFHLLTSDCMYATGVMVNRMHMSLE